MDGVVLPAQPPLVGDELIKLPLNNHDIKKSYNENIPSNNKNPKIVISPKRVKASSPTRIPPVVLPTSTSTSPISDNNIHGSSPSTISVPTRTPNHAVSPPELKKIDKIQTVNWNKSPRSIRTPPKPVEPVNDIHSIPPVPEVKFRPIQNLTPESPKPKNIQSIPTEKINSNNKVRINNVPTKPEKPNYSFMSEEEQKHWRRIFLGKYASIQQSYPEWNIPLPDETWSLDYTHDLFEATVKRIHVSSNTHQYTAFLLIFFLAIEVFCIKILGIDMSGYTKAQFESINKYNQLLTELGEKYYIQGPSSWPLEVRILIVAGINAVFFLAVRYLCKWMGNDAFAPALQSILNQLLSGGKPMQQSVDENGLPNIPNTTIPEMPTVNSTEQQGFNMGSILNGLQDLANGKISGDLAQNISNIGTMFTTNLANNTINKPNNNKPNNNNTNNTTRRRPRWNQ